MNDAEADINMRLRKLQQRRRRTRGRLFLAANLGLLLALVVAVGVALAMRKTHDQQAAALSAYQGTDLGGVPALDFQLVDQTGTPASLHRLRGHPVVLTFLYTHCPGPCQVMAEKLRLAAQALGPQAAQVAWVAVSLDPKGDTPASARTFVATHHLVGRLHFLLGSRTQLDPIWQAYFTIPQVQSHLNVPGGTTPMIIHSVGVFVLDGQGRERLYFDDSFDPATLASALRSELAA